MDNAPKETYQQIARKATRGIGWNYLSFGSTKLLSLLTLSILARLLPPENFGLVALATLTMDYLSVISDLGFGAALIQRREHVKEAANIAFLINLLANSALTLIIFLTAPLVAAFFREPQVTAVLRWLSLTFLIKATGSIHSVLLARELNFKKKIVPDLGNTLFKGILSIGLALSGFGVWALVAGQLAGIMVMSALLWYLVPWRPGFTWDTRLAKELFSYGISIMGTNTLSKWEDNFDYLVIGRIFNAATLGIYTIAYRLPEMLILSTMWAMTAVLFPAFSALQDEKEALKKGFLSTIRFVSLLVTPLCLGMAVAADPLVRVAFGDQWIDSIPILRVISLYTLVASIGFHAGDVYKAMGRPDILFKISLPLFPIRLLFLWVGAQYSPLGVAYAHLSAEAIHLIINLVVMRKIINVRLIEFILELKALLGGAALISFTIPALYYTQDAASIIRLAIAVTAGAIGYLGTIWFVERKSLISALDALGFSYMRAKKNDSGASPGRNVP